MLIFVGPFIVARVLFVGFFEPLVFFWAGSGFSLVF